MVVGLVCVLLVSWAVYLSELRRFTVSESYLILAVFFIGNCIYVVVTFWLIRIVITIKISG